MFSSSLPTFGFKSMNDEHKTFEEILLKSYRPLKSNETHPIKVNGECGVWLNKSETDKWLKTNKNLDKYPINVDPNPIVIKKSSSDKIIYTQEIGIRYLRPHTPPSSDIYIREERNRIPPPAPPVIIRSTPAAPKTPPPLIIREYPPPLPPRIGPKYITVPGPQLPPPPRKLIVERMHKLPPKPRAILIERWLPYKKPRRRVIFEKNKTNSNDFKTKNVIVEWTAPKVIVKKDFKNLGIVKADPVFYSRLFSKSLVKTSDLPVFLKEIQLPKDIIKKELQEPELYGDVDCLKLVDLDKEGLSEYKRYLESRNNSKKENLLGQIESNKRQKLRNNASISKQSISFQDEENNKSTGLYGITKSEINVLSQIFVNHICQITLKEIQNTFDELNRVFNKNYSKNDACLFFKELDSNKDGMVDYEDFKRVFSKLF
jgi:hypothetical protein